MNTTPTIECPICGGRGELAVPGTYGATVSPEALETLPCWMCGGEGETTQKAVDDYDAHIAGIEF
jgi:hypothetical protein